MYTLLSGAYKHYFRKDEYCILILGLDDSGKTTFLEQTKIKFSKGKFEAQPILQNFNAKNIMPKI